MKNLIKIMLVIVCALSIQANVSAQTNTNFMFVSWWQMTNYFAGVVDGINNFNSSNTSSLIISSGLTAITNSSAVVTNTNSYIYQYTLIYSNGTTNVNFTNTATNIVVQTNIVSMVTITTNGNTQQIANGGTGVTTLTNLATLVLTNLALNDPAYFADTSPGSTNVVTVFPVARYPGQLLMTFNSTIGGTLGGQLYMAGSDLSWRRGLELGWTTIFAISNDSASQALLVKGGSNSGLGAVMNMQNLDTNKFVNFGWFDSGNTPRGSLGFGNNNAPVYRGINYLDDNNAGVGFYHTGGGTVFGGVEKTTGDLVWYSGISTSSNNPFIGLTNIFRVQRSSGLITGNGGGLTNINVALSNLAGTFPQDNINFNGGIKAIGSTQFMSTNLGFGQPNQFLWFFMGNSNLVNSNLYQTDAGLFLVNLNPTTSGSQLNLVPTSTNQSYPGWINTGVTNSDGNPIGYSPNQQLSIIMGGVDCQVGGDLPNIGMIVQNYPGRFAIATDQSYVSGISGNYPYVLTDPTNAITHFPMWTWTNSPAAFSITNFYRDSLSINNGNGNVIAGNNFLVKGSLGLNNPTNVPANTNIVRAYMAITNQGVLYYQSLYQ